MGTKKQREGNSRRSKTYELHLVFEEVNGSVGKLVTGAARVTQRFNRSNVAHIPDVTAKAVDTPYSKSAHDNPYEARMSTIEQLLHKVRSGDTIHIFTADQRFKDIANDDPDVSAQVREQFKAISKRGVTIDVEDPSALDDSKYMDLADRMVRIRTNNLQNHHTGSRGYHR